jgi:hypothetical protein
MRQANSAEKLSLQRKGGNEQQKADHCPLSTFYFNMMLMG